MHPLVLALTLLSGMLWVGPALAIGPCPGGKQLAFPTAEGFGRCTQGGRGGRVIEVTTLNEAGPGSFKDALLQTGPRIIVFRVGGTIRWTQQFEVSQPGVTIAGQTAPGDGIQLVGSAMAFANGETIMRHLRVRDQSLYIKRHGIELKDAGPYILDHISTEWATAQGLSCWFTNNVTIQWSISAEHTYLPYGTLCHSAQATLHHNFMGMVNGRLPHVESGDIDVANNVFYGHLGSMGTVVPQYRCGAINWLSNYWKSMPNHPSNYGNDTPVSMAPGYPYSNCTSNYGKGNLSHIYRETDTIDNNVIFHHGNPGPADPTQRQTVVNTPFTGRAPMTVTSAQQAYLDVFANAGATKPKRDAIDTRVLSYGQSGTAFQGTQGVVNFDATKTPAVPTFAGGTALVDTDHDGMPDSWETANNLNPASATDGPQIAGNGYTNVENYLNELAGDVIPGGGIVPPPPLDTDGDGVLDTVDQCPTVVGPASNNGCPVVVPPPPIDTDGDGTPNATDQCPTVAGPASNNGCPVIVPPPVPTVTSSVTITKETTTAITDKLVVEVLRAQCPGGSTTTTKTYNAAGIAVPASDLSWVKKIITTSCKP